MARIVVSMANTHDPTLNRKTPERWGEQGKRTMAGGRPMNLDLDAMTRERESWIGEKLKPEVWERQNATCQSAIETLAQVIKDVSPDVAVIIGDDTYEVFNPDDHIPAVDVFWGETVPHLPHPSRVRVPQETPPNMLRGEPDLGQHIIGCLNAEGFDVSCTRTMPKGRTIGHAFDFIYGRIMKDQVPPHVPIFLNTYYPPNRPTLSRCYALGKALRRAIGSWSSDKTVAVIGTGGLSHLVLDEQLDHAVLSALHDKDESRIASFPDEPFIWGTSEIRNWMVAAGAVHESEVVMNLVAYEACYRSPAGIGCGSGFAYWR